MFYQIQVNKRQDTKGQAIGYEWENVTNIITL